MPQKLVHDDDDSDSRTSFDSAVVKIMQLLVENEKSYSIAGLAREVGIHRRTIQKSIDLLSTLEEILDNYRLKLQEVDNKKIVLLERRTGLLSYPEEVQQFIIRSKHFPSPSDETYLLMYLYLQDAYSADKAMFIEGKYSENSIKRLLKQGQVKKTEKGELYLSDEGITIAKGALSIFPDLKSKIIKINLSHGRDPQH